VCVCLDAACDWLTTLRDECINSLETAVMFIV